MNLANPDNWTPGGCKLGGDRNAGEISWWALDLTNTGRTCVQGGWLAEDDGKIGEIEEHGDILGTDGKSQPFFAAFEELYSGKLT